MIDLTNEFKECLYKTSIALDYVKNKRHFTDEIIEEFGIGYCPIVLDTSENNIHCMKNRITIAIRDSYGDLISMAGRAMGDNVKPKYINLQYHKNFYLYNLDKAKKEIYKKGCCIICEGQFDVITLWKFGFKNAVAVAGSAFSKKQASLISRYCDRAIIISDQDIAGAKAQRNMENILNSLYLKYEVVSPSPSKDVDSVLNSGNSNEFCEKLREMIGGR